MIGYYAGLNGSGEPELVAVHYSKATAKQARTTNTFGEALIGTRTYVGRRVPLEQFFTTKIAGIQYLRRCLRYQAEALRGKLMAMEGHDRRLEAMYKSILHLDGEQHDQA